MKQNAQKYRLFLGWMAIPLIALVVWACHNDSVESRDPQQIAREAAKRAYNEVKEGLVAKFGSRYKLNPDWSNSNFETIESGKTLLYVSLANNEANGNSLKMLFSTDSKDPLQTQIIEHRPAAEYLEKTAKVETDQNERFDGEINFYSLQGKFKTGGIFQSGILMKTNVPVEELNQLSNRSRTSGATDEGIDLNVVVIIGHRPETPNINVFIYIPVNLYNPNGGVIDGYVYSPNAGGGGGGGGGGPSGGGGASPGGRPLASYAQKCAGIQALWARGVANGNSEVNGVLLADGTVLITQDAGYTGGPFHGLYNYQGQVYYWFPKDGGTIPNYSGVIANPNGYFIPIKATIHSHTPCMDQGGDGVSNQISQDDHNMADQFYSIKHYVVGCNGTIGQFNGSSNGYINVVTGALSTTCASINP